MSVARRAEVQHSQHMNETTDLVLEDGVTVEVSLSSSAVVFVKGASMTNLLMLVAVTICL